MSAWTHKFWTFGHSVDWFGHVWHGIDGLAQDTTRVGGFISNLYTESIIRGRFPNISLEISKPQNFEHMISNELEHDLDAEDRRVLGNTISQLFSIHSVLNLIKSSLVDYDLVILSRYDNFIYYLPPLSTISRKDLTVGWSLGLKNIESYGFPDLVIIGPMERIQDTDAFENLDELIQLIGRQSAEIYKYQNYKKRNSKESISVRRIKVAMLRSSSWYWPLLLLPLHNLRVILRPRVRIRLFVSKLLGNIQK